MPESMQEVLLSCLILYTVRLLVNRLAGALPAPPRAAAPPAHAAAAGPADAAAASAAAGAAREDVAASKTRSEEAEGEGIKYEGYAEAIAAAQVRVHSSRCWAGQAAGDSVGLVLMRFYERHRTAWLAGWS